MRKHGYYDVLVRACAQHGARAGVHYYTHGECRTYTYSELYGVCEYVSQTLQLLMCGRGIVGIITERNPFIPCVIAAVHKNAPTFMFLDPASDNNGTFKSIHFEAIIMMHQAEQPEYTMEKKPDREICVFDTVLKFYKLEGGCELTTEMANDYSYIVRTSGSTGEPKHVKVPIECLKPNIDDLSAMFQMSKSDVVYLSTPLTFDPAMVELLLACENGASLLVAPPGAQLLFPSQPSPHAVTVWQTTPSNFFQFSSSDIATKILGPNSKLRVLAFGGEPMNHIRQLKELKAKENATRIFCLYGVTEMSCWASAVELQLDNMADDTELPLGNCLSETELKVSFSNNESTLGNILLGSNSRHCSILNKTIKQVENKGKSWIDTGDVAEVKNGTIYFRGRTDEVIKRFGHKVNLQLIEMATMMCPWVKICSCLWLPGPYTVILYYTSDFLSSDELNTFLRSNLDDKHWPDKIVRIESMPLNSHGKVCKQSLKTLNQSADTLGFIKCFFLKELSSSLGRKITYDEIKDKDYLSLGGSSFMAIVLCNKLLQTYPQLNESLFSNLLSPKTTIDAFIQILINVISSNKTKKSTTLNTTLKRRISDSGIVEKNITNKMSSHVTRNIEMEKIWSYNTRKCVDATPTICQMTVMLLKFHRNPYIVIGSHSGEIVVLQAADGEVVGSLEMHSRVEASVFCYQCTTGELTRDTFGVVGTYDGTIVCFSISSCAIHWKVDVNSMIKSKATSAMGLLYVASYDGNVRCLDSTTGMIKESVRLGEYGISADLVSTASGVVLSGSLGGACVALRAPGNAVLWRHTLSTPIFASPVLYGQEQQVVYAEVSGTIHCFTVDKGQPLWKYDNAKGNIFSSLAMKCNEFLDWDLLFGCHDSNVYCLNIQDNRVKLKWKTKMTAPVYSTPCYFKGPYILAASNDGRLAVMESENGHVALEYEFPGETFSSPVTLNDQVFIGCRDDKIYSLMCKLKQDSTIALSI